MRDGNFSTYARNIAALPRSSASVFIRSFFGGQHPEAVAGYHSTQLLQKVDVFVADAASKGYSSYRDLVRRNYLPLKDR
jgi:hypothetical protein